jgi:mannose-1-phosphate guanylyltransferase/phosphomannomutase
MNAVLFSGGPGTDISPEAWQRPRSLWPIGGGCLIDYCIDMIAAVGVTDVAIAANGCAPLLRRHFRESAPHGCPDHAERGRTSPGQRRQPPRRRGIVRPQQPILVMAAASYITELDLERFVHQSLASGAELCVGYARQDASAILPGIYLLRPSVLAHTKPEGYQDLKEQLIPAVREAGGTVAAIPLTGNIHPVLTSEHCLRRLGNHLRSRTARERLVATGHREVSEDCWVHATAEVDATARLLGPCVIGPGSLVGPDAVVSGPVVLERDVRVAADCVIDRSVLYADSRLDLGDGVQGYQGRLGKVLRGREPGRERTRVRAPRRAARRAARQATTPLGVD